MTETQKNILSEYNVSTFEELLEIQKQYSNRAMSTPLDDATLENCYKDFMRITNDINTYQWEEINNG